MKLGWLWGLALALSAGCSKSEPPTPAPGSPPPGEPQASADAARAPQPAPTKVSNPRASKDALIEAALAAVQTGDPQAYGDLLIDLQVVRAHCPQMLRTLNEPAVSAELGKMREKVGRRMREQCQGIDWSRAAEKSRSGGEARGPNKGCPDIVEHDDVRVVYSLDGKREALVSLENPFHVRGADVWGFFRAPKCQVQAPNALIAAAERARDAVCACETLECAQKASESHGADIAQAAKSLPQPLAGRQARQLAEVTQAATNCMDKLEAKAP